MTDLINLIDQMDLSTSLIKTQMISREVRLPPEFKHITKGRTRK